MISEFPLFVFTTLGGAAAGAYVVSALFGKRGKDTKRPWLFPLANLILLGLGLLGVLGHLGRPELFFLALANPKAMICQEAYWSIALGVVMVVDLLVVIVRKQSLQVIRTIAAIVACGLMLVMGNAYFGSYTNPAWAHFGTFLLFIVGDIALGAVVYAFLGGTELDVAFGKAGCGIAAALALSLVIVGVHFTNVGENGTGIFVAALVAAVAAGCLGVSAAGKVQIPRIKPSMAVLAVIAVVVARYAFYAASTL